MVRYLDYNPFRVFDNNLLSDVIHLTDDAKKMLKSMLVLFDEPTVHVLDYHLLAKHDIKLSDPLRYKLSILMMVVFRLVTYIQY